MERYRCYVLPHAFIVNQEGTIVWHGQVNRKGLIPSFKSVLLESAERASRPMPREEPAKATAGGKSKGGAKKKDD